MLVDSVTAKNALVVVSKVAYNAGLTYKELSELLSRRRKRIRMVKIMSEQITEAARALCVKFINKVETGRARSRETYSECLALLEMIENERELPIVVTLCGSIKFKQAFTDAAYRETRDGKIVLSVGCFSHADGVTLSEETKALFDELHKRKIDISREILVLNVGGYIGKSTQSEILYAHANGKSVRYLEN